MLSTSSYFAILLPATLPNLVLGSSLVAGLVLAPYSSFSFRNWTLFLGQAQEVNQRAYSVIKRIDDKLSGTDFRSTSTELSTDDNPLGVSKQVPALLCCERGLAMPEAPPCASESHAAC